ncbi:helix-turn-helix domain-containing protein [Cohnella suwonensis]|uniref:Helix-turn-helix domain-containing protein n=1 Tax=Cohnella suwonensis TaxID=696072 RepID=A0ABW0LZJ5_9BACL
MESWNALPAIVAEAAKQYALYQLLRDELPTFDSAENVFSFFGIGFSHSTYVTAILRFDDFRRLGRNCEANELQVLKYELLKLSQDSLRKEFVCEGTVTGEDHVTIIFNAMGFCQPTLMLLKQRFNDIADEFGKLYRNTISVGIGDTAEDIHGVRRSYEEAIAASEYRALYGRQSVIAYSDIAESEQSTPVYPYETEALLLHAIRHGNSDQAELQLDLFFESILHGAVREMHLFFMQLGGSISRVLPLNLEAAEGKHRFELGRLNRDLLESQSLEEKKQWFTDWLRSQMAIKDLEDHQKKEAIVAAAIEHIEANYSRFDLTVETVAEHIAFSSSYLRRLFKDVHGVSPAEYIFNLRLERAKSFLRDTDDTAKAIAEKVGYSNTKYFYNAFKKYVGLTTFEYREQYRS